MWHYPQTKGVVDSARFYSLLGTKRTNNLKVNLHTKWYKSRPESASGSATAVHMGHCVLWRCQKLHPVWTNFVPRTGKPFFGAPYPMGVGRTRSWGSIRIDRTRFSQNHPHYPGTCRWRCWLLMIRSRIVFDHVSLTKSCMCCCWRTCKCVSRFETEPL